MSVSVSVRACWERESRGTHALLELQLADLGLVLADVHSLFGKLLLVELRQQNKAAAQANQ